MDIIDLQRKARLKEGTIEYYWFENENIGLKNTLFHRINIPLEPFDSGLDYVHQPEETEIVIEWINLRLKNPWQLSGIEITSEKTEDVEASIYIGSAHNWFHIESLKLQEIAPENYELIGKGIVDFETEGVGKNEQFHFKTTAMFKGKA